MINICSQPAPSAKPACRKQSGFTLLDTITVLMLVSFLGLIAVPSLVDLSKTYDRINSRSYVVQDLKRAQAEAITEGCREILQVTAGGGGYTLGCDYLSYDLSVSPSSDATSFRRILPGGVTVAASGPIIFNSRGQPVSVDGIVTNVGITLSQDSQVYSSGTLLGTGVFNFD